MGVCLQTFNQTLLILGEVTIFLTPIFLYEFLCFCALSVAKPPKIFASSFVHSLTMHSSSTFINKVIGATTLHPTALMLHTSSPL